MIENPLYQILNQAILFEHLKPRDRDAHKGDFGHTLVIGGDYGMAGSVRMAAEAALRVGSGLVSVATREAHVLSLNIARPEVMCHGVASPESLHPLLEKASVIVLGVGLGRSAWSRHLFDAAIKVNKPLVVDADALNLLSEIPYKKSHWILTPHVGEAARLLQCDANEIQKDRFSAAQNILKQRGGVVVLKGADSIVQAENDMPFLCRAGNPGMASGGMGDVLSGVIGGLLSQYFSLLSAAKLGVMVHATAGDLAAQENGERGLLAMDLMPYLRKCVNPTKENR